MIFFSAGCGGCGWSLKVDVCKKNTTGSPQYSSNDLVDKNRKEERGEEEKKEEVFNCIVFV